MKQLLSRLVRRVQKLTDYLRKRRKQGLRSPVAKKNRTAARKRITTLRTKIRSLRINWNGCEPLSNRNLRKAVRIGARYGLVVTSTTGGTHAPGSYHYTHHAVDIASGSVKQMKSAQRAIERELGRSVLLELFGPAEWYIKDQRRISGAFPDHHDHVHIAA